MTAHPWLLASAAFAFPFAAASSQPAPAAPPTDAPTTNAAPAPASTSTDASLTASDTGDDTGDDKAIVVTGSRAPGSVIGDIPPENTLDSRDVRATGATSINELLDAIAPQIGSVQGRGGERPVLLLNGQRISSFREMRDIPTEAIQRVDILPEEVGLKYGYRADQKVVNIVLRQRFRSTTVLGSVNTATEGGYVGGTADVTRLMIQRNGRTTINLHAEGNGMLTEANRDILLAQPPASGTTQDALAARSLLPSKRNIRGSATFNRTVFGDVSGTLNTELEHQEGRSLIGLRDNSIAILGRNTSSDTAHAGFGLNGTKSNWHWTVTGNGDLERDLTGTDRSNPNFPPDRARQNRQSGDVTATANGNLFKLPAGNASTTLTLGVSGVHQSSARTAAGETIRNSLGRTEGDAAISVDLPISRRNRDFSALGNLTLNANAEVNRLSDFGSLTTLGAGANWSPVDRLSFITSWRREEGAPTIQQLGNPVLETPGTRIFDFATGQTVLVTAVTGGNANLQADRRNVVKLAANWQPFEKTDLRLRAEFVHQKIERPISNLEVTPSIEAAFPERFVRDADGQLVRVDLRPVNFDSSRRDALRIGFDFSKPLKSKRPSQSFIDQMRAQYGGGRRGGSAGGSGSSDTGAAPASPPVEGAPTTGSPAAGSPPVGGPPPGAPPADTGPGGFGGFGGGGGRGGGFGGGRGRLQFSLTDNITFVDKVRIRPGFPEVDFLHGDASGSGGGTPRHQVEAQAGWSNNGLGARLGANWRSGTTVNSLNGDRLRFSPVGTFDLRLFANFGDMYDLVAKHPWLRGSQLRIEATNLFDTKPRVHDAQGNVPLSYQPDLLNPLGRTVMISFRKLFSPSPAWFRQQRQGEQQPPAR